MYSFFRIIKFALQGFFRNFWLTLVTVTMMFLSLFSVTFLLGIDYLKQATLQGVEQKVDILVSLKPNVSKENLDALYDDLKYLPEVKKVTIITPEDNKKLFQERNADSSVLKALDIFGENENPFSYNLAVNAYDLNQYQTILTFIQQDKYKTIVESSAFHNYEQFISQINKISDSVNRYSWYIIGIFILISAIVIFNTIRMSIYTRKDEIIIIKLVGASNWFVQIPFIIESLLYALLALILVVLVVFTAANFLQPSLNVYYQGSEVINLTNYFHSKFWVIFGGQFLALAFLNSISTIFAVRKYLKSQ
ncbi:MAG: permease-like cell division protein FtsX [Patescibacteria group bacterium]|jgi:cell division transport system permease protein